MTAWLIGATALGCALIGGVFFAFSSFVMPALGNVPTAEGIRAMQRINIDVYNWSFMGAFMAMPVVCIVTAITAWRTAPGQAVTYAITGCIVYVIGNFVVTAAGNVPLNDALATADPEAVDAARGWAHYLVHWTRWNHVRTLASMVASGLFLVAWKSM